MLHRKNLSFFDDLPMLEIFTSACESGAKARYDTYNNIYLIYIYYIKPIKMQDTGFRTITSVV